MDIWSEHLGRLGGLVFYPGVSAISYCMSDTYNLPFLMYMFVCMGFHHIAIREMSKSAWNTIKYGNGFGDKCDDNYNSLREKLDDINAHKMRVISNGVMFYNNAHKKGFFDWIDSVDIDTSAMSSPSIDTTITQNSWRNNVINRYHLKEDLRYLVDALVSARKIRFKMTLALVSFGGLIGAGMNKIDGGGLNLLFPIISTGSLISALRNWGKMDPLYENVWNEVGKFAKLSDLIESSYVDQYQDLLEKYSVHGLCVMIDMYGNMRLNPFVSLYKTKTFNL